MELLKQRILEEGRAAEGGVLKVDSFLNHQMDISLLNAIGKEFRHRFAEEEVTKLLTIEASGIGIAAITAQHFGNVPVVFAKKTKSRNLDDFLAKGQALEGLLKIVGESGAKLIGCGIVIEKGFQEGGKRLREKGIRIESLAVVSDIAEDKVIFAE